ncbi:protein kinase C epsilon type-like [Protopterus annectens]|uniref:protein kinase C epsilon type-like n=1 Tax=Protopterus annectens TaxID=7888 RepID=UPI001CFC465B|nr:protein kinase C epsilon type-like [Protopterus annectens]
MAPEILEKAEYDHTIDWWAMGILIYEMMAGYTPYDADKPDELLVCILDTEIKFPDWFSFEAVSIIEQFLKQDPIKRLGSVIYQDGEDAIKQHTFFRDIDWVLLEQRQTEPPFTPYIEEERNVHILPKALSLPTIENCEMKKCSF